MWELMSFHSGTPAVMRSWVSWLIWDLNVGLCNILIATSHWCSTYIVHIIHRTHFSVRPPGIYARPATDDTTKKRHDDVLDFSTLIIGPHRFLGCHIPLTPLPAQRIKSMLALGLMIGLRFGWSHCDEALALISDIEASLQQKIKASCSLYGFDIGLWKCLAQRHLLALWNVQKASQNESPLGRQCLPMLPL